MANWKEYTTKTTPEDADEIMIADSKANVSKRTPFSGLWNWIAGKLATAVISQLETQNKSIIPALNELNSNKITTNSPVIRTDVKEYVLTLPSGKLHFFRTISNTPGAAATGSCIYIFYMLNEKTNGVGIAVSYSTPCVYYVKLEEGELKHIALS